MAANKRLLSDLLGAIVRHWGYEETQKALASLPQSQLESSQREISDQPRKQIKKRPRPSEIVTRYELPVAIRKDVLELAQIYEEKRFLPSIADVRNFLEVRGREIGAVKNRDQAFVKVIDLILGLPPEEIRRLRNSAVHGEPARLGPISDAIEAAGPSIRSRRERYHSS